MRRGWLVTAAAGLVMIGTAVGTLGVRAQDQAAKTDPSKSSYASVNEDELRSVFARMSAAKAVVMERQMDLLGARYDLGDHAATGVTMSRGKPVQDGVRVKLPGGMTWEALAQMIPEEIRTKGLFPAGFLPLPHVNHPEGGMIFPIFQITEVKKQTGRDLTRFDLDFDLPDRFLPELPAPIYLTTRPDLGDVSRGQLVTTDNYYALFNGLLNPKQLDGLRLLLTPFPQHQFNLTADRRSEHPSLGVACFDCHQNGSSNGATHLVGDIRPQEFRHRIETPSLRGVNIQRLFGSQRALKTVEDFTEFEQRAAYFGAQARRLRETRPEEGHVGGAQGQAVFFGKGQCAACHVPPYYTDNLMHNLRAERFYMPQTINGMMASADGPIKTFPLRGIKDTPPYLHDGRLLTLDDTVEFFNPVLGAKLTIQENKDLVAFLRAL